MEYVRVTKDQYTSPHVKNGWVALSEVEDYRLALKSILRGLRAELADLQSDSDENQPALAHWRARMRNGGAIAVRERLIKEYEERLDRLKGLRIDLTV